jgi:potassium channel subfamily K
MGLPTILSALHLFSLSPRRRRQRDPEEGAQDESGEVDDTGDAAENVTHVDEEDLETNDEDDNESYDPLADPNPRRRLHRLGSATDDTLFSSSTQKSPSSTTVSAKRSWYSRIKDYVFPPEESESSLEKFVPNYRWTPIISGVVVPFALLLEIPGLTEHWYIRTEANQVVESKSNSAILDVGLAISMACGLCANICLILRFLERRVKTVTILTMAFLTIHGTLSSFAIHIEPNSRRS